MPCPLNDIELRTGNLFVREPDDVGWCYLVLLANEVEDRDVEFCERYGGATAVARDGGQEVAWARRVLPADEPVEICQVGALLPQPRRDGSLEQRSATERAPAVPVLRRANVVADGASRCSCQDQCSHPTGVSHGEAYRCSAAHRLGDDGDLIDAQPAEELTHVFGEGAPPRPLRDVE